jgi:protein-tyrosine phosphatase
MIDLHAHLLPGIDDGPPDIDAALALARAQVKDGVRVAFATPHVYPGQWSNTRSSILVAYASFEYALQRMGIPLRLCVAGEVRLNADIMDLHQQDELPFLGLCEGMHTMLLEMPDGSIPVGSDRLVRYLLDNRIRPVLVHPERNKAVMEKPERLRPFVDMGCFVQLTAASVIGEFGSSAQRTAQTLIDNEWVDLVASDTHNLKGRAPRMGAARKALASTYGEAFANQLTWLGPAHIAGLNAPVPT